MEVFFSDEPGPMFLARWLLLPGMAADQPAPRTFLTDRRNDVELLKLSADVTVVRKGTARRGASSKCSCRGAPLGVHAAMGTKVAFQVAFNDQEEGDYYPMWTVEQGEDSASLVPHVAQALPRRHPAS